MPRLTLRSNTHSSERSHSRGVSPPKLGINMEDFQVLQKMVMTMITMSFVDAKTRARGLWGFDSSLKMEDADNKNRDKY